APFFTSTQLHCKDLIRRSRGASEPQRDTASNIELVQIVGVPRYPAPAPEWVAPVSTIARRREIGWSISKLAPKPKMFTHVVFCASTNRKSKAGRPLDAAPVRRKGVCSEAK